MVAFVRAFLATALACTVFPVLAQTKNNQLLFAVNEGSSGVQDAAEIFIKYEEFMNHIGRALGKKILFHLARDFKSLDRGLQTGTYQLALVRPTNFAAQAMRNYSYNLVVVTKGGFAPHFIALQNSKVKSLEDLRGARIALPDEAAYMTLITAYMLREHGLDLKRDLTPSYHRDQAVIAHAIEMGVADIGVVASVSKIAQEWEQKGGRVPIKGQSWLFAPIVASPAVSEEELVRLRSVLTGLDKTEEGKRILKAMGTPGFEVRPAEELMGVLKLLGA